MPLLYSAAREGMPYDASLRSLPAATDRHVYKPKNAKLGQKGRGLRYVTYFHHFCNPVTSLLIFGTPLYLRKGKVRDFEFGTSMQIDRQAYKQKCKTR